ncbi:MAG: 50S ribosomal protein L9 [Thermodesulfobacteriota bacterium]
MKVILTKEVLGLGDPGEVVEVKNGYARNYLVPQGMAMMATKKNMAAVEAEKRRIAAAMAKEIERVQGEAAALKNLSVTISAKAGEGGKLYGSVTNMDIAKALTEAGREVDRRRILLEAPIKRLGEHPVKVKLHPQVVVEVKVVVESSEPPAEAAPAAPAETADEE